MTIIIVLTVAMKITMMLIILNKQLKSYSRKLFSEHFNDNFSKKPQQNIQFLTN